MNRTVDRQEMLSGRAGLGGVQWAIKGRAARSMLRSQIARMLCPGYSAGPLQLTRAKFKPGRKINTYYRFPVRAGGGEQTTHRIKRGSEGLLSATWLDSLDSATPSTQLAETQEELERRGLAFPFINLWDEIPEWGIRMQIWPLDPEFPQLARLSDPDHLPDFLKDTGLPAKFAQEGITPIRYRPGERHVLRFGGGTDGSSPLYTKLYRSSEAAARAFRVANRVVDWLAESGSEVQGARPAGWSSADAAIVYPHVPGTPLSHRLRQSPRRLYRQLHSIGGALRTLHSGPESLAEELEPTTLEKECKVIRRASELVQALLPETYAQLVDLLDRAQALYARLPQDAPTFTHSDFKADHLMIQPDGLTLFDFDTCSLADPALDPGKFLADLDWVFAAAGVPGVEIAQEAFLNGYGKPGLEDRLARARIFHAVVLVKITARRAPLASPHWAVVTKEMIDRADQVLKREEKVISG